MVELEIEASISQYNQLLAGKPPPEILAWSKEEFGGKIAFASSLGLEDQVLLDMIVKAGLEIPVFTLDTGRLFPQTYDLLAEIEKKYGLRVRIYFPDPKEVEEMVNEEGPNLFRRSVELRKRCCKVRKLLPLRRALKGLDAWICGLRREQSVTRKELSVVELDGLHEIIKLNPLADWSFEQTWEYIKRNEVPYNVLHDRGFPSIGCACCTRAIALGEDIRKGRWWWESPEEKECGLHLPPGKHIQGSGI